MKIRNNIFVLIIFSLIGFTGCNNPIENEKNNLSLYGQVIDSQGNPVEGAKIHYGFEFTSNVLNKAVNTCPATPIKFQIPRRTKVTLNILRWYTREMIATLIDDTVNAGSFTVPNNPPKLTNGFYIYQMKTDSDIQEKIMFVKILDMTELENAEPLMITDSKGKFTLPNGIFGFGIKLASTGSNSSNVVGTMSISNPIKIIVCKPGYYSSSTEVTIDTTKDMNKVFTINKK